MRLTLYIDSNYLSPYALSAFVALREKSLAFTTVPVDLQAGAHRTGTMSALSATLRVPTLSDGDFHLSESSAIDEYLDEAYPGSRLYPLDPKQRAKAREIQAWIRSDLLPLRMERSTEGVFREVISPPLSEAAKAAADKLIRAAERMLPPGAEQLFGEWCIADTDLALMLQRLLRAGDAVPERLAAYARGQWQRPAVQAWLALGRNGQEEK